MFELKMPELTKEQIEEFNKRSKQLSARMDELRDALHTLEALDKYAPFTQMPELNPKEGEFPPLLPEDTLLFRLPANGYTIVITEQGYRNYQILTIKGEQTIKIRCANNAGDAFTEARFAITDLLK